ncbi:MULTISPECIES: hypothetical protein [Rhizobium/Agrobacterium group]|uniref:hypothetical protein n=1 Tax=Rhizobium/Agrobacterium group TaxID=227290 RepID=UPI0016067865|nr:hypothetical protein [Agrobacterium radiobacter]MBB4407093.1 hypothetical protein [Agrobacterium radiobacter]MBB4452703.1 hypothetical protein [Agrobacterium radiobacter]
MKAEHPTWMYSDNGPRLFQEGEDIPDGFVDSPAKLDGPTGEPSGKPTVKRQRRPRVAKE